MNKKRLKDMNRGDRFSVNLGFNKEVYVFNRHALASDEYYAVSEKTGNADAWSSGDARFYMVETIKIGIPSMQSLEKGDELVSGSRRSIKVTAIAEEGFTARFTDSAQQEAYFKFQELSWYTYKQEPRETITIGKHSYDKEDFEKVVKDLKTV